MQDIDNHELITYPQPPSDTILTANEFNQVVEMIKTKQELLERNKAHLADLAVQNKFLNRVAYDYDTYYNHVVTSKKNQIQMLNTLGGYFKLMEMEAERSNQDMEKMYHDQKKLASEINKIGTQIDRIWGMGDAAPQKPPAPAGAQH